MSGLPWTDKQTMTSVRADGAKVGGFVVDGRLEWWGYPVNGCPTGPHASCEDAKRAVDAALPFGGEE